MFCLNCLQCTIIVIITYWSRCSFVVYLEFKLDLASRWWVQHFCSARPGSLWALATLALCIYAVVRPNEDMSNVLGRTPVWKFLFGHHWMESSEIYCEETHVQTQAMNAHSISFQFVLFGMCFEIPHCSGRANGFLYHGVHRVTPFMWNSPPRRRCRKVIRVAAAMGGLATASAMFASSGTASFLQSEAFRELLSYESFLHIFTTDRHSLIPLSQPNRQGQAPRRPRVLTWG